MKRLFSLVFIGFLLSACGVNTSSSDKRSVTNSALSDPSNVINSNPVSSTGSTGSTDSNSSGGSTGSGGSTDLNCSDTAVLECTNAVFDANACTASTYKIAQDAAYDGTSVGENGSKFFNVVGQGLAIKSEYLVGSSADAAKTWVTLFYKAFPSPQNLGLQGYTSYSMKGFFDLSYDIAWSDASIANIDRTMYVKTNQGNLPVCHRLILNNIDGTLINVQKVYR